MGGAGGVNFIWTPEMREYKSIHNPMKDEAQKERMRLHNPMYDKKISEKVGRSKTKVVCYQGKETTCREIANERDFTLRRFTTGVKRL